MCRAPQERPWCRQAVLIRLIVGTLMIMIIVAHHSLVCSLTNTILKKTGCVGGVFSCCSCHVVLFFRVSFLLLFLFFDHLSDLMTCDLFVPLFSFHISRCMDSIIATELLQIEVLA